MKNEIEKGIATWQEHMLYPKSEIKKGEIHINPKTVMVVETIPFKIEDLEK